MFWQSKLLLIFHIATKLKKSVESSINLDLCAISFNKIYDKNEINQYNYL